MSRNQNDGSSSSNSLKTSDGSELSTWSNLDYDLLLPIMMELGPVDFFAFSRVCKSWRSLAIDHINNFMGSRRPMSVSFSTSTNNVCYLEDFEGRRFITWVPLSTGSSCVGVTCGYLIFFRKITCDFLLVNPFRKRQFQFRNILLPEVRTDPSLFRGILVFSPSHSRLMFVYSNKFSHTISFSLSGHPASCYQLHSQFPILDIHSFKGKIYTITSGSRLFEVRLNPMPTLIPLGMKNFPERKLLCPEFVNSDKSLYVVSCIARDVYDAYVLDFEKMECMRIEKPMVEYAFFVGDWKSSAAVNPDTWANRRVRNERLGYMKGTDKSKMQSRCLIANMWYFPHDSLT